MIMKNDLMASLDEVENCMIRVNEDDEIWQNRVIYAMCKAIRVLLIWAIKHQNAER